MVKRGHECLSPDENLGDKTHVSECASACREKSGCEYFIFGAYNGVRKGKCFWEKTTFANCPEEWRMVDYDFYAMTGIMH